MLHVSSNCVPERMHKNIGWICLTFLNCAFSNVFSWRRFEVTFEKSQWRKVKQMQPMWLAFSHEGDLRRHLKHCQRHNGPRNWVRNMRCLIRKYVFILISDYSCKVLLLGQIIFTIIDFFQLIIRHCDTFDGAACHLQAEDFALALHYAAIPL